MWEWYLTPFQRAQAEGAYFSMTHCLFGPGPLLGRETPAPASDTLPWQPNRAAVADPSLGWTAQDNVMHTFLARVRFNRGTPGWVRERRWYCPVCGHDNDWARIICRGRCVEWVRGGVRRDCYAGKVAYHEKGKCSWHPSEAIWWNPDDRARWEEGGDMRCCDKFRVVRVPHRECPCHGRLVDMHWKLRPRAPPDLESLGPPRQSTARDHDGSAVIRDRKVKTLWSSRSVFVPGTPYADERGVAKMYADGDIPLPPVGAEGI